jgi:hypothetical protein
LLDPREGWFGKPHQLRRHPVNGIACFPSIASQARSNFFPGQAISGEQVAARLAYTDVFLPNDDEARALIGLREPRVQAGHLAGMNPDCCAVVAQGAVAALWRSSRTK